MDGLMSNFWFVGYTDVFSTNIYPLSHYQVNEIKDYLIILSYFKEFMVNVVSSVAYAQFTYSVSKYKCASIY